MVMMIIFGCNQDVKVLLNTEIQEYDLEKNRKLNNEKISFDIIVNTLPPDIVLTLNLVNSLLLVEISTHLYFLLNMPFKKMFISFIKEGKVTRCH